MGLPKTIQYIPNNPFSPNRQHVTLTHCLKSFGFQQTHDPFCVHNRTGLKFGMMVRLYSSPTDFSSGSSLLHHWKDLSFFIDNNCWATYEGCGKFCWNVMIEKQKLCRCDSVSLYWDIKRFSAEWSKERLAKSRTIFNDSALSNYNRQSRDNKNHRSFAMPLLGIADCHQPTLFCVNKCHV